LRGVLRISGPRAREIVNAALLGTVVEPGAERRVLTGRFGDGVGSQPALVLWMPGPRSYTREDVCELHLPGSPPLLARAYERLLELGARAAMPGEFTRRAFLNGRIDLTRAEGVLELVLATNEDERRAAAGLLSGGLDRRTASLRDELEAARALMEASLDFDEADTGHVPREELDASMARIEEHLAEALSWETARQAPSALPMVVLFGPPNAGKSSLFNRLCGGSALVSDLAGTTRDVLTALWPVAPAPVLLVDGPGLDRVATGPDARAQELAAIGRRSADLLLWVHDASAGAAPAEDTLPRDVPVVGVWNQVDRPRAGPQPAPSSAVAEWVSVSAREGSGLGSLAEAVRRALGWSRPGGPSGSSLGRDLFLRHRGALEEARRSLLQARAELGQGASLDLVAETLRGATLALDVIGGRTTPEDLLDRIFARFCLGK